MAIAKARKSMKMASWFSGSKKKKKIPTVGRKVGQDALDAIKKRKEALDELMG